MGASTYSLNASSPVPIFPGGLQSDAMIKNVGLDSIWIGDSPNITPTNGFPLGAGSSLIWDRNKYLYALGTSTSSRLLTTFDIGNLFDADAIAAQISVSGAPPVDVQIELLNSRVQVTANQVQAWNPVDCRAYQSVKIWAVDEGGNGVARSCNLSWGDDSNPLNNGQYYQYDSSSFGFLDQGPAGGGTYHGSWASFTTPVRGAKLRVELSVNPNTTFVHVIVIGSYKACGRERWYQNVWDYASSGLPANCSAGGTGYDGLIGFNFVGGAASASGNWYLPSVNGAAKLVLEHGGGGNLLVGIVDVASLIYLQPGVTVTNNSYTTNLILPCRPLYVQIGYTGAAAWAKGHLQIELP